LQTSERHPALNFCISSSIILGVDESSPTPFPLLLLLLLLLWGLGQKMDLWMLSSPSSSSSFDAPVERGVGRGAPSFSPIRID